MSSKNNKEMSLAQKARVNASSGLLFFTTKIVVTLILNPLLIQFLGSIQFGIWKSIENFLGFASVADGKAVQALKWTIANQESSNDYEKKKRAISSALIIWFSFLPVLSFIIGILVFFAPDLIKNLNAEDYSLVALVCLLLGINLILTPLMGISESILIGINQGRIANYINIVWSLVGALVTYAIIVFGYGLVEIASLLILITVMRGLHTFVLCKQRVSWFGLLKPKKIEVFSFLKFSSWVLGWSFISRFLLAGEIFLLSILIGPDSISKYVFTSYVSITGVALAAIITSSVTPGLGMLIGKKDYIKSQYIVNKLREVSFAFGVFLGICILLLNSSFVYLWAGKELYLGFDNNLIIVLLMLQLICIRNEAFIIDLSLNIRRKVLFGAGSVLMSLALSTIGYYLQRDISSILFGIMLGRFLLFILFPLMTNKMIGNENIFLGIPLNKLLIVTLLIAAATLIGNFQQFSTWFMLITIATLEIAICSGLIYFFLLSKDNKYMIRTKIKGLF